MDPRLKKAIELGQSSREHQEKLARAEVKRKQKEYQDYIKSKLPAARKWIDETLFDMIIQSESKGTNYMEVYIKDMAGLPARAIYEAAKEIDGLIPIAKSHPIYENAEYVGESETEYRIAWGSEKEKQ